MITEIEAIVTSVQSVVSSGGVPGAGEPPRQVLYRGQPYFVLRSNAFECAGCKDIRVPQYPGGMNNWNDTLARWVADHARCTGAIE